MSPHDIRKFKKATSGALLKVRTIHTEQMSPGRRRFTRTSTAARLYALVRPSALATPGIAFTVAAGFLIVEAVLVGLLKQVDPQDPVGIVYAVLMGLALVGNFVAGVAPRPRQAQIAAARPNCRPNWLKRCCAQVICGSPPTKRAGTSLLPCTCGSRP